MDGMVAIFGIASVLAVVVIVRNTIKFVKEGKQGQGTQEQPPGANVHSLKSVSAIDSSKTNTGVKQEDTKPKMPTSETSESNTAKPKTIPNSSNVMRIPISVQGSMDGDGERIARIETILGKYVEGGSQEKE